MKNIHNINKWSFGITLTLYLTFYLGLIAQALLGLIQIILAISLLSNRKKLDLRSQKLLMIYWVLVIIYWLIFALPFEFPDPISLIAATVVPMLIASYFVYVTYSISKVPTEIENGDVL